MDDEDKEGSSINDKNSPYIPSISRYAKRLLAEKLAKSESRPPKLTVIQGGKSQNNLE